MKQAAPPLMNTYRPRLVEVPAMNCGDGRYVLLTETPRYMPAAEFEAAFELVDEKRTVDRRLSNGNAKPPKGKKERRAGPGRRKKNGDVDPRVAEGLELLAAGKSPKEVAAKLKVSQSCVYLWRKNANGAKPKRETAAAAEAPAKDQNTRRCRHCSKMTSVNGKWCIHCMQDP